MFLLSNLVCENERDTLTSVSDFGEGTKKLGTAVLSQCVRSSNGVVTGSNYVD